MLRQNYQKLQQWSRQKERKPLILKGARQVGKTYLLEEFGNKEFPQTHYFNFEKETELSKVFEPNLDPTRIINELSIYSHKEINPEKDLIIFDEIQAIPKAITSLKYFNEDMAQCAVCCAGSLLGIQLTPTSYPVGKTETQYLYPMTFIEFLWALDEKKLAEILIHCDSTSTISELVHERLWKYLKWYFIVGGLPEVVTTFCQQRNNLFTAFQAAKEKQQQLIAAYYADVAKHSGKINAMHINRIWQDIPAQLARTQDSSAKRFAFRGIIPGIDRYSRLAGAIDWLDNAGLIIKVPIINSGQLPLSAYTEESRFKLFMFDIGILTAMSNLPAKKILDYDYGTYKGYFAENFVAQELASNSKQKIYSWQEKRAELEFLMQNESWRKNENGVIPIEVKSGWITKAKSLETFSNKYNTPYKVIMSAKNLYINNETKTHYYPLYLAGRFAELISARY